MLFRAASNSRISSSIFQSRRTLYEPARKGFTVPEVFADARTAEYAAAAIPGTSTAFPQLNNLPEVIVTGRANSGKSSLFNAVVGRKDLLHTSSKAGRTRQLNFFRVGPNGGKLVLVDAPGYGKRGKAAWGDLFEEYITSRPQLRRIYMTFNGKHHLNTYDEMMLKHLSDQIISQEDGRQRFTIQAIITKGDEVTSKDMITKIRQEIWEFAPLCLPPIVTSVKMSPPFGVDEVRRNIVEACQV